MWLVPLLPLTGAVVLPLVGKCIGDPKAGWLATTLMALAFVWSVVMLVVMLSLPGDERSQVNNLFTWFQAGTLQVPIGFLADPLSVTWILLVTGVGSLIHLYAIGYMRGDERFSRFFAYFNLFVTAMLVLVLTRAIPAHVPRVGGRRASARTCSLGFWFERTRASSASLKAFVTNRVGDFGFMIAMFFIVGALAQPRLLRDERRWGTSRRRRPPRSCCCCSSVASARARRSVSILAARRDGGSDPGLRTYHAATMVTAGVFRVCRAESFFERSDTALAVVAIVGALTAILGPRSPSCNPTSNGCSCTARSQLGYMFLAAGVSAYSIAVFFVIVHPATRPPCSSVPAR